MGRPIVPSPDDAEREQTEPVFQILFGPTGRMSGIERFGICLAAAFVVALVALSRCSPAGS